MVTTGLQHVFLDLFKAFSTKRNPWTGQINGNLFFCISDDLSLQKVICALGPEMVNTLCLQMGTETLAPDFNIGMSAVLNF